VVAVSYACGAQDSFVAGTDVSKSHDVVRRTHKR
jgi:hypothetical protein